MDIADTTETELRFAGRFIDYYDARLFVPKGHFDEAHLIGGGRPEEHVLGAFARFVRPGDVVLDIGANIGTHSFALASLVTRTGKVYAVEADIDNVGYLRASIVRSAAENIFLLPIGAAEQPGIIRAQSTANTNTQFAYGVATTSNKIAGAIPLDPLIKEKLALVKIDIEGAELLALRGLAETIDQSRPVILSEFSPAYIAQALKSDLSREFFDFFDRRDYACYHLDHTGIMNHKLDHDELIAAHKAALDIFGWNHLDLVFVPSERPMPEKRNRPAIAAKQTPYAIPGFILRRPALAGVPWRFEEPSLAETVCQLCTSEQFETPEHTACCNRLGLDPASRQRKVWEFVYILATLEQRGKLTPGMRGLGFGTGREPLPSCFAAASVQVVATDAPEGLLAGEAWAQSEQWSRSLEDLWVSSIVSREAFFERVAFRPADMNAIPGDLREFDFCWSACCLEHLGSIRHGLDFIRNSVATLKPGGIAVHTTEFNLGSEIETYETPVLSLLRKSDIEQVIQELVQDGHEVEPLNLWPGANPIDAHVDLPPYSDTHLKLEILNHVTTSIGIVVKKR